MHFLFHGKTLQKLHSLTRPSPQSVVDSAGVKATPPRCFVSRPSVMRHANMGLPRANLPIDK